MTSIGMRPARLHILVVRENDILSLVPHRHSTSGKKSTGHPPIRMADSGTGTTTLLLLPYVVLRKRKSMYLLYVFPMIPVTYTSTWYRYLLAYGIYSTSCLRCFCVECRSSSVLSQYLSVSFPKSNGSWNFCTNHDRSGNVIVR